MSPQSAITSVRPSTSRRHTSRLLSQDLYRNVGVRLFEERGFRIEQLAGLDAELAADAGLGTDPIWATLHNAARTRAGRHRAGARPVGGRRVRILSVLR